MAALQNCWKGFQEKSSSLVEILYSEHQLGCSRQRKMQLRRAGRSLPPRVKTEWSTRYVIFLDKYAGYAQNLAHFWMFSSVLKDASQILEHILQGNIQTLRENSVRVYLNIQMHFCIWKHLYINVEMATYTKGTQTQSRLAYPSWLSALNYNPSSMENIQNTHWGLSH